MLGSQFGKPRFTPNTVHCARCEATVHVRDLSNHLDGHELGVRSLGRHSGGTTSTMDSSYRGKRRKQ